MKIALFAALALACVSTSACTTLRSADPPPATTPTAPAEPSLPAASDYAIRQSFGILETTTQLVNLAIDAGAIMPGTPLALQIANGLDQTRNLLNAASAADRIGNAVLASDRYARALNTYADVQKVIASITKMRGAKTGAAR